MSNIVLLCWDGWFALGFRFRGRCVEHRLRAEMRRKFSSRRILYDWFFIRPSIRDHMRRYRFFLLCCNDAKYGSKYMWLGLIGTFENQQSFKSIVIDSL